MSQTPRRILITGASGLVGMHLVPQLAAHHELYAISRTGAAVPGAHTIAMDLGRPWTEDSLPQSVDAIIHLAQSNLFREFPENVSEVLTVNTMSTIRLLDFARRNKVKNFIIASSGGVYGNGANTFSEDSPILAKGDLGFYLGTRLCAEILAEPFSAFTTITTLRFFFVYGPGQRESMLIPRLIRSVQSETPIKLQGPNGLSINPVHVTDATAAIISALSQERSDKFNIAGCDILSLRGIVDCISSYVGKDPIFLEDPVGEASDLVADISRMSSFLHHPKTTFSDGVRDLVQHMTRV